MRLIRPYSDDSTEETSRHRLPLQGSRISTWPISRRAGGTAGGQLGQSLVVFHGTPDGPAGTGIITTTQPDTFHAPYFDNSATRIERGRITVEELWYGPSDATRCPTGRAEAVWKVQGKTLVRTDSRVTVRANP